MTIQLKITDGSNTFTQDVDFRLIDYVPQAPSKGAATVTETITVQVYGGNASADGDLVVVNRMFDWARYWAKLGQPYHVWLEMTLDGVVWQSTIRDGVCAMQSSNWLDYERAVGLRTVGITIERMAYWDGAEAQLGLTNRNGTGNTSGLTVFNHTDAGAGHDNFVSINYPGTTIADQPSPCRIEMTNTYATGQMQDIWIGQNFTDPANFPQILEGEAATGGSTQSDAGCSGGQYQTITLATTVETILFTWTLSSAFLNAASGRFYKLMARWQFPDALNGTPNFMLRAKITDAAGNTLWTGDQVKPYQGYNLQISELHTLRLPMWLTGLSNQVGLKLVLTGQIDSGSLAVPLDFIQATPLDGWCYLKPLYSVPQNNRVMLDAVRNIAYMDDGSGNSLIGGISMYGNPIMLKPNQLQRLYFLTHSWSGNVAEIDRTISVKVFWRPRRMTL